MRLLVVDDEPAIRESTARLAETCGFEAATCADHRALAEAAGGADVILLDVQMPGLDVHAYLGVLRADPRTARARVVLFSARMDVAELADRVEADGFLEKPFTPAQLRAAVASATAPRASAAAALPAWA